MDLDDFLDFVSTDDDLGLLDLKVRATAPTADEHLLAKFNEINDFYVGSGREPEADFENVSEYMLHQRLIAIRGNKEQCAGLMPFDIYGLLKVAEAVEAPDKEINSVEDIFEDDLLGLLDDDADSIFNIRNVPKKIDMPDKIASRKVCKNFDKYEALFKVCHADLKSGDREQQKFTGEQQIQKGQYFVLHGIMCYVADMEQRVKKNGKINAKLHLIFENGTESNMLLRSLATELYKDESGRRILPKTDSIFDSFQGIQEEDQASGYIYILKSKSSNPSIKKIPNLYKIGFSTTSVEKRIANADKEPTYLMAAVHLVSSYKCYNMNTQKFEKLLHTFFGEACLELEVTDLGGNVCKPREWFVAPLKAIEIAIQLLINGEIVHYRYEPSSESVVEAVQ